QTFLGAWNLDKQVLTSGTGEQLFGFRKGAGRVVSQQRGDFQRYPTINSVRPVVDCAEQVGSAGNVFQRQVEEQFLPGLAFRQRVTDAGVVRRTVLDGVVEDSWVRGESGYRQLVDVVLQRTAVEQVARDIVEPKALSQVLEQLRGFHNSLILSWRFYGFIPSVLPVAGRSVPRHWQNLRLHMKS